MPVAESSGKNEARARLSLGSVFELGHRPQEALEAIEAAQRFYAQGGYRRESIQAAIILGNVLRQLGEFEEGIRILNDTLPQALQLQDARSEAQLRERLGLNLRDHGEWQKALREFGLAAPLYASVSTSPVEVLAGAAGLQWRLGRREAAEQSLMEAEQIEARAPNLKVRSFLTVLKAELAYADGRYEKALELAKSQPPGESAEDPAWQLALLQALVQLRLKRSGGLEAALAVVDQLDRFKLTGDSASAKLATAEALVFSGTHGPALKMAREALEFFEPKKIWEAVLRCHLVVARASQERSEVTTHLSACGSALTQLKNVWPAEDVMRYLARPDIKRLSEGIQLG